MTLRYFHNRFFRVKHTTVRFFTCQTPPKSKLRLFATSLANLVIYFLVDVFRANYYKEMKIERIKIIIAYSCLNFYSKCICGEFCFSYSNLPKKSPLKDTIKCFDLFSLFGCFFVSKRLSSIRLSIIYK